MRTRLISLVILLVLAGGAIVGAPLHANEQLCSMGDAMAGMDCCKAALMKAETAQSAAARLCCAVNCSQDGTTPPGGMTPSPQSRTAFVPQHPANAQALVHPLSALFHVEVSHGPPTDSHPAYIRHLALLI